LKHFLLVTRPSFTGTNKAVSVNKPVSLLDGKYKGNPLTSWCQKVCNV
jgi:hypothetical protein